MGSQKLARRLGVATIAVLALLAASYFVVLGAASGWPMYQHDPARSGLDPNAAAVTAVSAGWNTQLDGSMYAQPLVTGSQVYAATENNTVYALDVTSGAITWSQHLSTPVTSGLPCGNINPSGITGTPVIDTANNVLYAAALQASPSIHHELYALNLNAGGAVLYHYPIDAPGSTPTVQGQRGALTLANGKVYVPYSGRAGDCGNYTGRVVGVNAGDTTGASLVSYILPNTSRGGIWAAASADGSGNIYVASGNSNATGSTPDRGESVIKLSATLQELDFFTAPEWANLNATDTDIGSIGPILLQNGWIVQSGKNGMGYLLNSASLGHVGGQLFEARICDSGQEALAFGAYLAPSTVFIPCTSALKAVHVNTSGTGSFTVTTVRSSYGGSPGSSPPIIAGGVLWNLDTGNRLLLGFDPNSGAQLFSQGLAGTPVHFVAPSSGAGHVFVPAGSILEAFNLSSGSATPTPTSTSTPTKVPTSTPTNTPMATNTATSTPTAGITSTSTATATNTAVIPTPTPTNTSVPPTPTNTSVPTSVPNSTPPALVQSAVLDSFGTTGAVGYANPVGAGNLLIAAVRIGDQTGSGTVTDNNANTWQLVDRRIETGGGGGDVLELWYAYNVSSAPNARPTVSIRSSVSSASLRVIVAEYSGVQATSGVLDQHATATGNSASATVNSGVTAQANELVIGYGEVEDTSTFTPGSGYAMTASVPTNGAKKMAVAQLVTTTSGAQTASFGISGQAWAIGIATFRGAGATSTSTNTPTATATGTSTSTAVTTSTPTQTPTNTPMATNTPTSTPMATSTPTPAATSTPTRTATPVVIPTATNTPVHPAPALVQSAVLDTSGTTGAVGFTNAVASGNLLIAAVRIGDQTGTAMVTDNNANAWQLVDRRIESGGFGGDVLELWYAPNASSAPNARPTVSIKSSVSSATLRVIVAEYSGVLASNGVLDQHATATGNGASATVNSGVTAQPNELVIAYGEVENTSTFTPGSGYATSASVPTNGAKKMAVAHLVATTSGAQTASFGISSQAWAIGVATFRGLP